MKEKTIKFIKNNALYIKAFITGLIIILLIYNNKEVIPFGSKSLLCVDFFHQYGPMLAELYDRVKSGESLIYSFNTGLGLPFFRNFMNYLSSPFNIIMFLFNRENLLTSYSFIIGLKAITACTTMVYYLSKKFNTQATYLVAMGVIYAFGAYFTAYYWNIMWLDGLVFLPLITYGIERLVNKGTWKYYTITLAIMLIANYFIGYMICIFSVVYFIIYALYKTKFRPFTKKNFCENYTNFFKKCVKFGIASLISGLLGAGLLLPMASSMASISATGGEIPTSQYYDFQPIDYLMEHLSGVEVTVFASDDITAPNISCGILSIALVLAFVLNLEIPIKKKICYGLILGFFIFAFFNPQLDYILHAFHVPNDLPYRYSFLYSFVLTIIATYGLINIKKFKFPVVVVGYLFLLALLFGTTFIKWDGIETNEIYINMILLTLYFMFYAANKFLDNKWEMFYYGIILISIIDVSVTLSYNWNITQVRDVFYEDYKATTLLYEYIDKYDQTKFYRVENTNMLTLNDGAWYDYYGMNTFSSMSYESMAKLQHALGMPGNEINSYYYVQNTPIYDLMFDIKYFIGEANDKIRYQSIKTYDETANEFIYNIGLGFGANKTLLNWNYESSSVYENQNDFMYNATGVDSILEPMDIISSDIIYTDENEKIVEFKIDNKYKDNMYFYEENSAIDFVLIGSTMYYINDNYSEYSEAHEDIQYDYVEEYDETHTININSTSDTLTIIIGYASYLENIDNTFDLYTINQEKFETAYEILNNYRFDIEKFEESYIKGKINVGEDMIVYTSIQYDKGWHVYVDGKEVKTYSLADSLLVFDADAGVHTVELKYSAPYMKLGIAISILTVIGLILDHFYEKQIIAFIKKHFPSKNIKEFFKKHLPKKKNKSKNKQTKRKSK